MRSLDKQSGREKESRSDRTPTVIDGIISESSRLQSEQVNAAISRQRERGFFPHLGHRDRTGELSELPARGRRKGADMVVLHRTGADINNDTLIRNTNQSRHVGGHYLIDDDGTVDLTAQINDVVYHARGHNESSIGIEMRGAPTSIPMDNSSVEDADYIRKQLGNLHLSPEFKQSLLSMSNKELFSKLRGSSKNQENRGRNIYEDISGQQKQELWYLVGELVKNCNIDRNKFRAHSNVNRKTLGEGINTEEFVRTMFSYLEKVKSLQELIKNMIPVNARFQKVLFEAELIIEKINNPSADNKEERGSFFDRFYHKVEEIEGVIFDLELELGPAPLPRRGRS